MSVRVRTLLSRRGCADRLRHGYSLSCDRGDKKKGRVTSEIQKVIQALIKMNLLVVDDFLAVVGMITDPDKNKKRETCVVSEYLIAGVYRNRKHRGD